jgi:hypothetical protein
MLQNPPANDVVVATFGEAMGSNVAADFVGQNFISGELFFGNVDAYDDGIGSHVHVAVGVAAHL